MILIIGAGRTGWSTYEFLKKKNIATIIYDDWQKNDLIINDINDIPWEKIKKAMLSPGIETWNQLPPVVLKCRQKGIPLFSDLDFLYHYNSNKTFIGITGSQGKTTIHDAITKFLTNKQLSVSSGGNNGVPALSLKDSEFYVLEVSMQLLFISQSIVYNIGIFNNFFDTHEEMGDFNFRLQQKRKLLIRAQGIDQRFIIGDFPKGTVQLLGSAVRHDDIIIYSSSYHSQKDIKSKNYVFINGLNIIYNIDDINGEIIIDNERFKLIAEENIGVFWALLVIMGYDSYEDLIEFLKDYQLVDHRLTLLKTINKNGHQWKFFNGSKCTNSFAFKALIKYVNHLYKKNNEKNYWILGGVLNSPVEFFWQDDLHDDTFFIYGSHGHKIYDFLKNKTKNIILKNTLEEIIDEIKKHYLKDNVNILLTPGCQSFDQFKDFEDRGRSFSNIINNFFD